MLRYIEQFDVISNTKTSIYRKIRYDVQHQYIETFDVLPGYPTSKTKRRHLDEGDEGETSGFRNEVSGDAVSPLDGIVRREVEQGVGDLKNLAHHVERHGRVQVSATTEKTNSTRSQQ